MAQLRLREGTEHDAVAISTLINAAFRPERFFTDRDRTNPGEVRTLLKQGTFLLGEDQGVLVVCVYLERRGDRVYLGLLSVDPTRQRSGFGTWMMQAAEDYCRSSGARAIDLKLVNLRRELPAYYRQRGYVETGILPWPPQISTNQPCHFICMAKELSSPEE